MALNPLNLPHLLYLAAVSRPRLLGYPLPKQIFTGASVLARWVVLPLRFRLPLLSSTPSSSLQFVYVWKTSASG